MKKFIASLCTILMVLCVSFAFVGCTDNTTETVGKIGDTVTNSDGVDFTLVSCENTKQIGSDILVQATTNNFILLTIKVTNNSQTIQTIYGSCADLYNSKGKKYKYETSLYIDYIISEDIGVGNSKIFQVVFVTPTTTVEETYTVKIGYSMYTSDRDRVSFELSTKSNNSETDKLAEYYAEQCPISVEETNFFGTLRFVNLSQKKIISYEALFVLYNIHGERLIYNYNTTPYNKIEENPSNFTNEEYRYHTQYLNVNSQVYTIDIFVYYALYEDRTSWGNRADISVEKILELGTKFTFEREI